MDIRRFCRNFEWEGAVLWFLPYQSLPCETTRHGLQEIEPSVEFVNTKTGERVIGDEPEALTKAKERAEKIKAPLKSDWQMRVLWNSTHMWFWLYFQSIAAVDFPEFDDNTPIAMRMFAAFWNESNKSVAERWKTFSTAMPSDFINALIEGFESTRDNPAPAKAELGQGEPDDPKGLPTGDVSEATTSSS